MPCIVAPLWCSDRKMPTNTYICNEVNSKNKFQWARFTNALPQSKTFFGYCQDLLKCHSVSVVTERDTGILVAGLMLICRSFPFLLQNIGRIFKIIIEAQFSKVCIMTFNVKFNSRKNHDLFWL